MSITLRITDAGRAALVNAAHDGTNAVRIASAGVSPTAIVASGDTAALPGEVKRIATVSGSAIAADVIHLVVRDESADTYTVRSFALYLADGTLFASYGQPTPIIEKSSAALLLLAVDATLVDIAADHITFGSANFLNPPATADTAGVVELATEAEAMALADAVRALTPKTMASIFTAANILARLRQTDGAGSGLDADLLDGFDSNAVLLDRGSIPTAALDSALANGTYRSDQPIRKACWCGPTPVRSAPCKCISAISATCSGATGPMGAAGPPGARSGIRSTTGPAPDSTPI